MNTNLLVTDNWSNMESEDRYLSNWPDEPDVLAMREQGEECRSCSFWAKLNDEWGLCCNAQSRHHLETVFEHFTCPSHIDEGLGPHSFTSDKKGHCVCGGRGTKYMKRFTKIVGSIEAKEDELSIEEPVQWPEGFLAQASRPNDIGVLMTIWNEHPHIIGTVLYGLLTIAALVRFIYCFRIAPKNKLYLGWILILIAVSTSFFAMDSWVWKPGSVYHGSWYFRAGTICSFAFCAAMMFQVLRRPGDWDDESGDEGDDSRSLPKTHPL